MRFAPTLLAVAALAGAGCTGAVDRREEPGCPPGVPCQRFSTFEPEGPVGSPRRTLETRLDALPLVGIPRRHPEIGGLRGHGSLSIGSATTGFVVNCRPLAPVGPHHAILAEHSRRGTACATDELVDAILRAAEEVDRDLPGARLGIGNLGRVGGGDIPWSVSHHSGRDADLAFYLLGPDGKPFLPGTLIPVDGRGLGDAGGVPVRFDVARNWRLVRSLLENRDVSVQWLFVSRSLRRALLEYAKKRKEPPALQQRAEEVLAQPARSRPHNDHLHLRIDCPPDDVLEGCRDTGTERTWYRDPSLRIQDRVRELLPLARSADATTRADATTVLGRIGTAEGRREVLLRLNDDDPDVRRAAADALVDGGVDGIEQDLVTRLEGESDGRIAASILRALDRHADRWRRPILLRSLLALDRSYTFDLGLFEVRGTIRDWALDAMGRLPIAVAVRLVMGALDAGALPPGRAARALREWTGAEPDANLPDATAIASAWRGWWKRHKDRSPREWWAEALRLRGLDAADAARARAAIERGGGLDLCTHRWFAEALGAVLGIRVPRFEIEPMATLLQRAVRGEATEDTPLAETASSPDGTPDPDLVTEAPPPSGLPGSGRNGAASGAPGEAPGSPAHSN